MRSSVTPAGDQQPVRHSTPGPELAQPISTGIASRRTSPRSRCRAGASRAAISSLRQRSITSFRNGRAYQLRVLRRLPAIAARSQRRSRAPSEQRPSRAGSPACRPDSRRPRAGWCRDAQQGRATGSPGHATAGGRACRCPPRWRRLPSSRRRRRARLRSAEHRRADRGRSSSAARALSAASGGRRPRSRYTACSAPPPPGHHRPPPARAAVTPADAARLVHPHRRHR